MPVALAHRARLATLDAMHRSPVLSGQYVLKGGLVLHHVYGSPRPSEDLDFNAVGHFENEVTEGKEHRLVRVAAALDAELEASAARFSLAHVAVQNKRFSDVLPTLMADIGYTQNEASRPPFTRTVEMQVTLSEIVCETRGAEIDGVPVLVPTLDDIAADKLKTLLQNSTRAVLRKSDAWDLWWMLTHAAPSPEPARVARFLHEKCHVWGRIACPSGADFRVPRVRRKAGAGYQELVAAGTVTPLPDFKEVWRTILRFIDALGLPPAATA